MSVTLGAFLFLRTEGFGGANPGCAGGQPRTPFQENRVSLRGQERSAVCTAGPGLLRSSSHLWPSGLEVWPQTDGSGWAVAGEDEE